ncbi:hypothetical protein [Mycobacteroides abscessus]|uniref:hypothetical protein n=1 Tax=Mycobacteroides abscessus TaxID=36809 RepID=UPI0009277668|nr:hypothetical protein [Mycobacteroides abscessus]SIF35194.1 Uncharacterised protein [Mycobacteroides abscessus subsp. abscessus]
MTTQHPPRNYAVPTPVFGRWKPWLQAAIALFAAFGVTQLIPVPAVAALGIAALLAGIPTLWRACLLARDEGREHRAAAEEQATGTRPYGHIPPVLPAQPTRRPRFWVLVGAVGTVVYTLVALVLIKATTKVHHSPLGNGRVYGETPNLLVVGALGIGFVAFLAYIGYRAVLMHLRANECISAPIDWWDGAGELGYPEGLDYAPTQDDTSAYAPPTAPQGSRADDVFARMRDLTPEELQRFADLMDADEQPSDTREATTGKPSLDDLLDD